MKFSIKTEVLKNISATLNRTAARGSLDQGAGNVTITISSGKVSLKMHQVDFFVSYTVAVETDGEVEDGVVVISVEALETVVASLVDTVTRFVLEGKKLLVSTNSSSSEIYLLDEAGEAPVVSIPDGNPTLTLQREVLLQGFKSVQHAAAESVVKPEIASVYLYTKNDSVYFVATDAFRLAEMRFLSTDAQDDVGVLIPIKSVAKILRVLEGASEADVRLYLETDSVFLSADLFLMKTNGVQGAFPDYTNIMPKDFTLTLTVLKSDVVNFLKKARLFSNNLNKLLLRVDGDAAITLEFSNELVGVTKNTIPAAITGSADTLPSFNYKLIHDALSVITDDRVVFSAVNDQTKPLMIRGADDSALTAIVSPLLDKQE